MFGKRRGRPSLELDRSALEEVVARIVWGFASLSAEGRHLAVQAFNRLHDDPRNAVRYSLTAISTDPKQQKEEHDERLRRHGRIESHRGRPRRRTCATS